MNFRFRERITTLECYFFLGQRKVAVPMQFTAGPNPFSSSEYLAKYKCIFNATKNIEPGEMTLTVNYDGATIPRITVCICNHVECVSGCLYFS